jgi:hypothetical protein
MVEAPPGREFLLAVRFVEHNNMFEMREVKSDTFSVYSTVKFGMMMMMMMLMMMMMMMMRMMIL